MMKVAFQEKIRPWLEEVVEQKLIELLGDPDAGLELREEIVTRLKKTLSSKNKSIPLESVAKKLKLKW